MPLAPAVRAQKTAHGGPQVPGNTRLSLRNGLTAYFALSPATNSSCHRRQRIDGLSARLGSQNLRQLDTSNGCQDHTALPYAATSRKYFRRTVCDPPGSARGISTSFVRAHVHRSQAKPALRCRFAPDAAASTASHPASVTIAKRPSLGWDGAYSRFDLPDGLSGIFSRRRLDDPNQIESVQQISFCAQRAIARTGDCTVHPIYLPRPRLRRALNAALRDLRSDTSEIRAYLCVELISLSILSIDSRMTPETASGSSIKLKQCCGTDQKYSLNSAELGAGV